MKLPEKPKMKKLKDSNKSSVQESSEDEKLQELKEKVKQAEAEKEESSGTPINIDIQSPMNSGFRDAFQVEHKDAS